MVHRQSYPSSRHGRESAATTPQEQRGIPEGFLRPQLRVGRQADFSSAYEWDYAINQIHEKNRRKGMAVPLAGIACHYVLDKEIRMMLEQKYSDAFGSRQGQKRAVKEYGGLGKRMQTYIDLLRTSAMIIVKEGYMGEHPELMGKTQTSTRQAHPNESIWQDTTLKVRKAGIGVQSYGNKLSFDLSQNSILYDERREVVNYLRSEEGLDTRQLPKDWRPHATFFVMYPHLSADLSPMKYPADLPEDMDFHAPATDYERALNQH